MRRPDFHSDDPEAPDSEQPAEAPLPDRTRIQASPFAIEEPADRKPASRKGTRNAPSVIVGAEVPDTSSRGRPSSVHIDESWDAPAAAAEVDSTRVGPAPSQRPMRPARRSSPDARVQAPPEPEVSDPNVTRIAPAPSRREPRVADENATQAGPPFTVEVTSGPDRGLRMPLRGGRMIVGRGDGCDLRLTDNSSSRRHVELVGGPTGLVVRDLGSGNGTRVNGERITEVTAGHGDEIAVGQTVLRVIDDLKQFEAEQVRAEAPRRPPPRATPRGEQAIALARLEDGGNGFEGEDEAVAESHTSRIPLPRRGRAPGGSRGGLGERLRAMPKKLRLLLAGGFTLLLLVIGLGAVSSLEPAQPPGPPPQEARYDELFEEGKKLLRQGDHEGALLQFQEASTVIDKPELARYIETCERDGKGKKQLDQAKRLAVLGEHDRAIAILKAIEERAAAWDEAKELVVEYEEARVQAVGDRVRAAITAREFDEARGLLSGIPEVTAQALRAEIDAGEREAEKQAAAEARDTKQRNQNARTRQAQRTRQEVAAAVAGVVRKIDTGNFDGATRELDRVGESGSAAVRTKTTMLRRLIPRFASAYEEGVSKYNGGALEAAAQPLTRALTIYEEMDLEGTIGGKLKGRAAKANSAKGRAALARQEYGTAAKAFRLALKLDSGDRQAKEGLNEISRRAKDVYLEGYVEMNRSPDVARRRFREVMEMVASSDEVHQDAKRRLAELEAK